MILVRPMHLTKENYPYAYKGTIYAPRDTGYSPLTIQGQDDPDGVNSPVSLNKSGEYSHDPWLLHTVSTSYEKMRMKLKQLIALYGTDNVRVAQYVPIDYEVLPNQ